MSDDSKIHGGGPAGGGPLQPDTAVDGKKDNAPVDDSFDRLSDQYLRMARERGHMAYIFARKVTEPDKFRSGGHMDVHSVSDAVYDLAHMINDPVAFLESVKQAVILARAEALGKRAAEGDIALPPVGDTVTLKVH